jgi:hypothetical protein
MLNLDNRSVADVEAPRKDRGDVEGDCWITSKHRLRGFLPYFVSAFFNDPIAVALWTGFMC